MRMFRRGGRLAHERLQRHGEGDGKHQRIARDGQNGKEDRTRIRRRQRGIDLLLGEEAEEGRQPAHRDGGGKRNGKGQRHGGAQAAETGDVARSGLVVDDPRHHEQRTLEQ